MSELRLTLLDFAAWYNTQWLVARYTRSGQGRTERQGDLAA